MSPSPDHPETGRLLDAILPHVAFDGWSDTAFRAAAADCGMPVAAAQALCPRGAVDLAVAWHRRADAEMVTAIAAADLSGMRFRDRVAFALRARLAAMSDKEAVRRATALFALPHHAAEGAALVWGTADAVWNALGDTADDLNWYTKRATLAGVWGATLLYWLGDSSPAAEATHAFIDRRIDEVMRIEKAKAQLRDNRFLKPVARPMGRMFGWIRAPRRTPRPDMPGHWTPDA